MWISDPTPVINSTKQIDSWSICIPKSTCRLPTGIQVNKFWMMVRASPCRLSRSDSSVEADSERRQGRRAAQQVSPRVGPPAAEQQYRGAGRGQRDEQPDQMCQ